MHTWEFRRYAKPDDVGWAGVIVVLGEPIAYVGLDRRISWVAHLMRGAIDEED